MPHNKRIELYVACPNQDELAVSGQHPIVSLDKISQSLPSAWYGYGPVVGTLQTAKQQIVSHAFMLDKSMRSLGHKVA